MENQELFKQAILDAKAVRETAMAAARTTLAEHFEPFIKETMEQTLAEKSHDDKDEKDVKEMKNHEMEESMKHDMEEGDVMDEASLDEILAELDALSEKMAEESVDEGHVKGDGYDGTKKSGETGYDEKAKVSRGGTGYPEKAKSSIHEAEDDDDDKEEKEDDKEAPEAGPEPATDDSEVVDITVGDLKDIIRDVFMQLQGGGDFGSVDQDTFDADTQLAGDLGVDDSIEEGDKEISLEEILAELEAEEKKMEEAAGSNEIPGGRIDPEASDVHKTQYDEMKKELKEAVKTIKALRTELNEVNLFSAKMLYVNKIFKSKNLTEAQKTKVINAFDRATSVKEVENTYQTLLESIGETKKSSLRESVGFASKAIGNAPARPIVEADAFVSRWQQLAGIK